MGAEALTVRTFFVMGTFEVEGIHTKDIEIGKFYYEKLSGKFVLVHDKEPVSDGTFMIHYIMYNETTGTYDTHKTNFKTLGII